MFTAWIILFVIIAAFLFIPISISLIFFQRRKKSRRSPLTSQLLRGPGESLRRELENVNEKLDDFFMKIIMAATFAILLLLILAKLSNGKAFVWQLCLLAVCYGLIILLLSFDMYRLLRSRQDLYLGLDGELAVGQELNLLMLDGYRIFHDFPAENFNIDHIAIGSNGVFAVETKGRAKPLKGDVNIIYDGEGLKFPTHYEREPLEQAKRQAAWLAKWLTSSVGAQVAVKPVLVLPGWYIVRKKPGMLIYNGKNPQAVFKGQGEATLSAEMIQRISHQVEQRCRDVAPGAYQIDQKKKK
jgi:hypothetical protein